DPGPAHDPRTPALEARFDQVGVGDVLEPTRHRVQPAAARSVGVSDPGPHLALVGTTQPPVRDDLRQLRGYLSSSSESRSRSSMDQRSGIWSRSATMPKSIFPQ